MAKRLRLRGGTTAEHSTFTGSAREVTVDTDKNALVVHDGATAGGIQVPTFDNSQVGKNAIINGDFGVNQYADIDTAPIAMTHATYQTDRYVSIISGVTGTLERQSKSLVNNKYVRSLKCVATSTATGRMGMLQRMELFYNGETKTFGVWVKSNNANARALIIDSSGTYSSNAHTGGGSWEFLNFGRTIDIATTSLSIYVEIADSAGASVSITTGDYIESTMWQLESGSVTTPFEQLLPSQQLANCQRYYQASANDFGYMWIGDSTNASTYMIVLRFPTTMRSTPTVTLSNQNVSNFGTITTDNPSIDSFIAKATCNLTGTSNYFRSDYTANSEL